MAKIRVLITDDHHLVRNGLRLLLARYDDIEVVGEAANGEEALDAVETLKPDVLLIDVSMPVLTGHDAAALLRKSHPNVKVLFLSMHEEPEYVIKAMKSGASGYLSKNVEGEELAKAIHTVASGEQYFSSGIYKGIMQSYAGEEAANPSSDRIALTAREKEILVHIANGLSNKEIAEKLFISPRTVETHRVNMMKKLDVSNTAELIKLSIVFKLIDV